MNYFDILLAKKLEDDRDPKVEGLSVTENGRYHEEGVVYDPVIVALPLDDKTITQNGTYKASDDNLEGYDEVEVNVPLPQNAYLLKDIPNTPTAIATFTDGANLPMPKLEVGIEPIQEGSGDPSPTNIRPISGWDEVNVTRCGKNLFGGEKLADVIVAKVPNATKNATNKTVSYSANRVNNIVLFEKFKPNTRYTIIANMDSGVTNLKINYSDGTKTSIQSNDVTVSTEGKTVISLSGEWQTGDSVLLYEQFGIFEGVLTASDFEPYNGHTYTIDLDGTRYGGKVDLVSGVMVVDRVEVDLGSLTWVYESNNNRFYTLDVTSLIKLPGDSNIPNMICSQYLCVSYNVGNSSGSNNVVFVGTPSGRIYVKDSRYSDATAFKTAMNGVQLVYELATPLTIQLSPTLVKSLQINNVFADSGDVLNAEYFSREE